MASQVKSPPKVLGVGECIEVIENYGYDNTVARFSGCGLATAPNPNMGIPACVAVLVGTGVSGWVATIACTAGAFG